MEAGVALDEQFNEEAESALLEAIGEYGMLDGDPYPDGEEARRVLGRWAEADALDTEPMMLDLLESGGLEL